jgi:acetylornithine deacetylase/succinyl-diaminopimelate desuccinylase-like protein
MKNLSGLSTTSRAHTTAHALIAVLFGSALAFGQSAHAAEPTQAVDPAIAAAVKGISAARVRIDIEKLVSFGTRSTISAQDAAAIAAGRGVGAAREWLKSEFELISKECGGCLEVKTDEFVQEPVDRIPKPTPITNVYAVLKGTDAENAKRIVLVTGHYDSRNGNTLNITDDAPGANDDASGTAVSLESARALSKSKFRATLIFLTVAGEEQRSEGAKHFAQMAKQEGWNIEAVLDDDIVGGDKSPGQDRRLVRVFSEGIPAAADEKRVQEIRSVGGESDSLSRELARYILEVGGAYSPGVHTMLVFRPDRYRRGGDHSAFNQQGFAAVRFTEYRENFNHQHQNVRTENRVEYGDTLKYVDFDYVARVARLNALTLAALATAPAPPREVKLVTTNVDNDSTLKWQPSSGASGYEVLWRATNAPTWEHAQKVGNTTTATLKISKDNVIFAVRARDEAGHRSLPVVPESER